MKRDAIQLRKSPTFTRKITKVANFENELTKIAEKTVTKSAEKRKIQVSSPAEIKKKVKKTNIIKTITNEPEGKFENVEILDSDNSLNLIYSPGISIVFSNLIRIRVTGGQTNISPPYSQSQN